jgi:hypothetical protein
VKETKVKYVLIYWIGKPKGKRSLEKLRHKWEDEIRMDLGETGWGGGGCVCGMASIGSG